MKAGFWVAPEGAEDEPAVAMLPIGGDDPLFAARGDRRVSFLATAGAEELVARCPRAAGLLTELIAALRRQSAKGANALFDLTEFGEEERELIGHTLGEGEVSGQAMLADGVTAQIQESVMAGLWRVRFFDSAHSLIGDYVEVGAIPEAVRQAARLCAPELFWGDPPAGVMNALPVLAEIRAHMTDWQEGAPPHVISFSLFPMSPDDMSFLQASLGNGPAQLISDGYGSCRILATGARHVWSVQYFNAAGAIILDTLEIGGIPAAALAADEDFQDSADRLAEIDEAYFR